MRVNDDTMTFSVFKAMKYVDDDVDDCSAISVIDNLVAAHLQENFEINDSACDSAIFEFYENNASNHDHACALKSYPTKFFGNKHFESLGLHERITKPLKPSIVEPPEVELKELPTHLKYAFLGRDNTLPVIVAAALKNNEENQLLNVLKNHKKAIGWTMADIRGISPSFCMHRIRLVDENSSSIEPQRRLNPTMKEVVKKEVIKWLDAGVVYPICDSSWVSPLHCVPKKGGITVVLNEKNELIPTRTITGWRICQDFRKLNAATKKDHFPLPFIDQMLDKLAGQEYFCFLDGYSGYNQIPLAPEDQHKTTFTCPYGTFAFRRMSFGLCNAPATFQRCMTAIFNDMIDEYVEVFMDDFTVFRDSFENCLLNLC
ncbi:uncharacterized protein LOC133295495 [Gastrolobium bilobum]|uniref:uncharacterized protein LOC133295495 n=1 Tax=Gastrolobium bilobum TaxID=150636 RepID=UPI002AAFA4E1|nr:uncharacterized protein LOC133295495 [Gastrolobium bilobum]